MRVLFVCLGNICRSPTAEAVFRAKVAERGLNGEVEVDSAGTGGWHAGNAPDRRAVAEGERRGVSMSGRARQVSASDLRDFDLVIAMDESNRRDLLALATDDEVRERIQLLRDWDPEAAATTAPCRIRTTAATASSPRCSTSSSEPATGSSTTSSSACASARLRSSPPARAAPRRVRGR